MRTATCATLTLVAALASQAGLAQPAAGIGSSVPDMSRGTAASPVLNEAPAASSVVLLPARRKRILEPRTGSAPTSGISGTGGASNQSGGRPNGINDGADATRGAAGGAGTIATPMGSKPLQPRDRDTSPAKGRHPNSS